MFYSASSKTYPEDIECVIDPTNGKGGIFISNVEAAQNINTLKRHGIEAILTAAFNINLTHNKNDIPYYKHVPGKDHEQFDLSIYFNESVEFIHNALEKTNILVHCMAGVSRSVTLVLAFLIKKKGLSLDQAYSKIKSRRKIIHPNDGFIQQLRTFEQQCNRQSPAKSISYSRIEPRRSSYYESPLKKYYESPTKSRYESPYKVYEPSPLNNNNRYINPERASMRGLSGLSGLKFTDFNSTKRRQDYMDIEIENIKKKYSKPEEYNRSRHSKSKSIMENVQRPSLYRDYDMTSMRSSNMFGLRKLTSMYDHLKF